jgi:hypothetical protein
MPLPHPRQRLHDPPRGTLAAHDSLLPEYRGFVPLSWSILNGEDHTGVTLFYLDDRMDGGDIVAQKRVPIGAGSCAILFGGVLLVFLGFRSLPSWRVARRLQPLPDRLEPWAMGRRVRVLMHVCVIVTTVVLGLLGLRLEPVRLFAPRLLQAR